MKSNHIDFKNFIEQNDIKENLFARGFLFSNNKYDVANYPFYYNWNCENVADKYYLYIDKKLNFFVKKDKSGNIALLIGHAYNPLQWIV